MRIPPFLLASPLLALNFVSGQTLPNPGFEADTFTVAPGYVLGNAPVTGWTGSPATNYGLNPAGGSPFANNGMIPQGNNVAFLQSTPAGTTLGTTVSGLVDGQRYQLSFRANARIGQTPRLDVLVDAQQRISSVVRVVGGVNPYTWISLDFTANGTTAALEMRNSTAGDHTVNVDAFAIAPTTAPWFFADWFDDASSGVDRAFLYTHAYCFGAAASTVINEVPFTGIAGTNPAVPGSFSTTGLGSVFANDPNNITGGSRVLANDFLYNGFPSGITLSGLTPGTAYLFTLYSAGWEDPGARWGTFKSGSNSLSIDQDTYGNDNGIRFEYSYTADATGTVTIETWPIQNASIHWYGFSNRETGTDPAPMFITQPQDGAQIVGNAFTFSASATGTRPIGYQWYHDGVALPGANENSLTVTVSDPSDAGFYRVEASSAFGMDTSATAFLEVYDTVPGLLFNTGVDATGVPLASGVDDPHYLLLDNPNGAALIPAVTQANIPGAWLPNGATSLWVGPASDTVGAAGGDYTYQTTFDLTGLPPELIIAGQWATDNLATAIRVNGLPVPGVILSGSFAGFTDFVADTALLPVGTVVAGPNSLEFSLNNAGAGFTGLRVENLSAAAVPAGIAPVIFQQPQSRDVTTGDRVVLSTKAYGTAVLNYQWFKGVEPIDGATGRTYTIASATVADAGNYSVVVTNGIASDTSEIAVLTATDVPPSISEQPKGTTLGTGESYVLSVTSSGSPTLAYQWMLGPDPIEGANSPTYSIPSAGPADAGTYSVVVSNPFGLDTSDPATILVRDRVPGLYNTGVDATGVPLGDASVDPHYVLLVNPNGAPLDPAIVEDSTRFPIVTGPWIANNATSKWIGPAFFTEAAAGGDGVAGDYTYLLSFDLTGFDLPSVMITGGWSTDNAGIDILLNGVSTGIGNTNQFTSLTPFAISSGFQPGINTLEFILNNSAVGYTGLRVDNLRGLGMLLPLIDLPQLSIAINGAGNPLISFLGQQGTGYRLERSMNLQLGQWTDLGLLSVPGNGIVSYEDSSAPVGQAYYHVLVTP